MNMMQQHIQQGMHGGQQGMPGMSQGMQGMMQHGMPPMGMGQGNMPNFQNPGMMQHGIMGLQVFFFFACVRMLCSQPARNDAGRMGVQTQGRMSVFVLGSMRAYCMLAERERSHASKRTCTDPIYIYLYS